MRHFTGENHDQKSGAPEFTVFGISHQELAATYRETFSLAEEHQIALIHKLKEKGAENILILSTCNRTEVYSTSSDSEALKDIYLQAVTGSSSVFGKRHYSKSGNDAIRHLCEVAAGLHSQILGDFEIIGQVRRAFKISKKQEAAGAFLERLVNSATQMSKQIKNQTAFSSGVTSTAYAAVSAVRNSFDNYKDVKLCIYGLGKIGSNVCENLVKHFPVENVRVLNRSLDKARKLADKYKLDLFGEDKLQSSIGQSNALIVATGASSPTVLPEMIPGDKELLIIDLSVPRNVHQEIDGLANCTVLGVDEISKLNEETIELRKAEISKVNQILEEEMAKFLDWVETRKHASAIQAIKNSFITYQQKELLKAKKNPNDERVQTELEFSSKVINRITGQIFSKLKDLEQSELETVYKLFSLDKEAFNE